MKKKRKMGAGKKETSNQQGKSKQYSKAQLAHEAHEETRRRKNLLPW